MRKPQILVPLLAALLLTAVVLAACGSTPEPTQSPSQPGTIPTVAPAPDGATLLETRCGGCHAVSTPKKQKLTRDEWDVLVTRMVTKGAKLTDAEKAVLIDYLAQTYGP